MFKEKLGICLYGELIEEIFEVSNEKSTKDLIQESDNESNKESNNESIKEIDKVSNKKSTKKSTKELIEELDEFSDEYSDEELDETFKNSSIERLEKIFKKQEESIKDLNETSALNSKNTTNWYDKNKFNRILTTIDSNNFNYKNRIGKFKFNDINNLMNNIKNKAISESDAKKKINELNELKKVDTKGKRLIISQKTLLKLLDGLTTIFKNNTNEIVNEDNNKIVNEDNNVNDNDNDNNNKINSKNMNKNESENESEKDEYYYEMRPLNNWFETID